MICQPDAQNIAAVRHASDIFDCDVHNRNSHILTAYRRRRLFAGITASAAQGGSGYCSVFCEQRIWAFCPPSEPINAVHDLVRITQHQEVLNASTRKGLC